MRMDDYLMCLSRVRSDWQNHGSPRRVLIALSGGVDSVALFCLLLKLAQEQPLALAAVHVNHGLRKSAAQDADFCRQLCKTHSIPFFLETVHLSSAAENEARQARYTAIAKVYAAWQADALALAHHRSDQAETLLLHLFRGSGTDGLCGMRPMSTHTCGEISMQLFRPLLQETKATLSAIARQDVGAWCEDETNASDQYLRNFLRLNILPKLQERVPGAEEAICRAAEILQAESDYLDHEANLFLEKHACTTPPVFFLEAPFFFSLHVALRRRILRNMLPFPVSFSPIEKAADMQPGETVNLPDGWRFTASDQRIYLLPNAKKQLPIPPLDVRAANEKETGDGIHAQTMALSLFQECTLRYRMPGDYLQPFGMQGKKTLQDYLVDRKIDAPFRDHLPLLCCGREVIWVIGVGPSEKVRCNAPEERVLLAYTGRLPYEKM